MAAKKPLATRRKLRAASAAATKNAPLGSGARFKALEASVAAGGARNPGAVAGSIERKKYGNKGAARLSAMGRKRGH